MPNFGPLGPTTLEGPVAFDCLPPLCAQLPSRGREPEIVSAIATLVGWDEAAGDEEAIALEDARCAPVYHER